MELNVGEKLGRYKLLKRERFEMRFSLFLISLAAFGQSTKFEPPRQADGHPDLQGVWRNSAIVAAFNVEGQEAFYNEPGGKSVIVDPPDGKLPYLPAALKQANDNHVHRERDPTGHCHTHGVPRLLVPPFPIEIVEDSNNVVLLSETEHSLRIIPLDGSPHLKNYRSLERRFARSLGGRHAGGGCHRF